MDKKHKHKITLVATMGVFNLAKILCKNTIMEKIIVVTGVATGVAGIAYCCIEEITDTEE